MNIPFQTPKPSAATHEGWQAWHQQARTAEPLKYFVAETLPEWVDDHVVMLAQRYWEDATYWVRSRTYNQFHWVRCNDLQPGYHDSDERLLQACFSLLEDFVEIELACWDKQYRRHPLRWLGRKHRSRELGLKHLDWEITLTGESAHQAAAALEKKALYLWWKDERPQRLDPSAEYFDYWTRREAGEALSREMGSEIALRGSELEEAQRLEDNTMLKRLVDVRSSLWT